MHKLKLSILLLISVLAGCAGYGRLLIESYTNPLEPQIFKHADGTESLYYQFSIGDGTNADTYLFFIGGSGCHSHKYYLRQYLEGLSGNIKVLALQKRAVGDRTTGLFGCSDQFHEFDYFAQWVSDQSQFVSRILNSATIKPRKVLMFGVSEGANVAAAIAASESRVTHLAIIGHGGMKQIDELRILAGKNKFPDDIENNYRKILTDPTSTSKRVYGHGYRYWASALDLDPMDFYSKLTIPVLVGFGENDSSVPVEAVYYMKERFQALGKSNLTLFIYPGADHVLNANGKSFRPDFFKKLTDWL
ncbi:MAG: prolyl oligopeptidase family serine peptidase [Nitrospirae bacterium]|nr:prolyl oligopeptidase family serine peptidase [Nitrospirota bacterium]